MRMLSSSALTFFGMVYTVVDLQLLLVMMCLREVGSFENEHCAFAGLPGATRDLMLSWSDRILSNR